MIGFVLMAAFYAIELSKANGKITSLYDSTSTLNKSVSNIQSDNELLTLSIKSERQLREHLQRSINENENRLDAYIEYSTALKNDEQAKQKKLDKIIKESANENCINAVMPHSVISLFNSKAD